VDTFAFDIPAILPVTPSVLARTDATVVALPCLEIYPYGLTLRFLLGVREGYHQAGIDPLDYSVDPRAVLPDDAPLEAWPPQVLRIGVRFANGAVVTNLKDNHGHDGEPSLSEPSLTIHGGRSYQAECELPYLLRPLPPVGPFTIVCEWPARGIDESRRTIDAEQIHQAAPNSIRPWTPTTWSP
jgi:hypothetical protein